MSEMRVPPFVAEQSLGQLILRHGEGAPFECDDGSTEGKRMFLYHGTTKGVADLAFTEGIKARGQGA